MVFLGRYSLNLDNKESFSIFWGTCLIFQPPNKAGGGYFHTKAVLEWFEYILAWSSPHLPWTYSSVIPDLPVGFRCRSRGKMAEQMYPHIWLGLMWAFSAGSIQSPRFKHIQSPGAEDFHQHSSPHFPYCWIQWKGEGWTAATFIPWALELWNNPIPVS